MDGNGVPQSPVRSGERESASVQSKVARFRALSPLLGTVLIAGLVAIALIVIATGVHGKVGLEKTVTFCVKPFGGFWLLFTGYCWQNFVRRKNVLSGLGILGWLVLTAAASGPVSGRLVQYLESRIEPPSLSADKPLGAVLVLGGGTGDAPHRAQVTAAGDRVVYGAQLYHEGKTRKLITSGQGIAIGSQEVRGPAMQTVEIWTKLGVPREAIITLDGINTYKELESLQALMDGALAGEPVGLLTSALHLPRAMRLAKARGLEVVPIAADYRYQNRPFTVMDYLPGASALRDLEAAEHEVIAALVNR
jgi:uncharacterized SAM-binding protein YcdF (DUF218 family)